MEENIKKARKMLYSLMGSGLHGYDGLDPEHPFIYIKLVCYHLWSMPGSYTAREEVNGYVGEVK